MYCLYAILGRSRDLIHKSLDYPGASVILMGEGIGMIPLSERLLNAIDPPELSYNTNTDPRFEFLSDKVAAWVRRLSRDTRVAYVEAELINGEGTESAVMWRDGNVTLGPLHGTGAVKQALHALGVLPRNGRDAFELVGLGKRRNPNEWLVKFH